MENSPPIGLCKTLPQYIIASTQLPFFSIEAQVNWVTKGQGTLHFAITNKAPELKFFEFLVKQGADVNLQATPAVDTPVSSC